METKTLAQTGPSRIAAVGRKSAAVMCAAALAGCMTPTSALAAGSGDASASKTEVVYVKADANGSQSGVYVVNQFDASADTTVHDAGTYTSIKNLTDEQELDAAGTSKFEVAANETYLYQGDLAADTELPWTVNVGYTLDGREVDASELAGKSGTLELTLSVQPNKGYSGNYADNYLLQVSGSLDNELAAQIKAPKATKAQASGSTQLSYMVFPGKTLKRHVTVQITDFEFDGWQVVGVPLAIALDIDSDELGDASGDLGKLEDASASLDDGATKVEDGAGSLADAIALVGSGSANLSGKASDFASSGSTLLQGSDSYSSALTTKADALSEQAKAVDVSSAQSAYAQAAQTYTAAFAQAFTKTFSTAYAQYVGAGLSQSEAQAKAQQDAQANAKQATAEQYSALQSSLETLVKAQATQTGLTSAADALREASKGYAELGQGIESYIGAAQKLADGASSLSAGTSQLADGASSLSDGAKKLAEGTGELREQTSGISDKMVDKVRDKLEDYLNPSFTLKDFVNGSTKVDNVQFVYKTDAIQVPDEQTEEADDQDDRGFVEKFLALFGL